MKWKPAAPSPVMHTTSRSGLPSFAPRAEGTPVPSMPSSRMLRYERGRVGQARERRLHVGDDAERQRAGHADVPRVDVDLDDSLRGRIPPVLVVREVEVAES